ncbi:hypothetical protein BCR34DRAFT_593402 [Clohesyomyces aquaticus]|uniref:Uncharacterized protein n=1 Tax=Clohesyomyces aquaticus TaxID=1231657 RepID=A0A1Y1YIF7_9PLEO|nr:hypothetical protein BCR34DRAFT_593402 [Clohesyomyces aquaticus]
MSLMTTPEEITTIPHETLPSKLHDDFHDDFRYEIHKHSDDSHAGLDKSGSHDRDRDMSSYAAHNETRATRREQQATSKIISAGTSLCHHILSAGPQTASAKAEGGNGITGRPGITRRAWKKP